MSVGNLVFSNHMLPTPNNLDYGEIPEEWKKITSVVCMIRQPFRALTLVRAPTQEPGSNRDRLTTHRNPRSFSGSDDDLVLSSALLISLGKRSCKQIDTVCRVQDHLLPGIP